MKQNKTKIKEGVIFGVPIGKGFAVGLMARYSDHGILAYFLNRLYDNLPTVDEIRFEKNDIIYIVKAGDLGLKNGSWPILGTLEKWNRDEWNVPVFYKKGLIDEKLYAIHYNDELKFVRQEPIDSLENISRYPTDGTAGYEFVEKRLSKLLKRSENE